MEIRLPYRVIYQTNELVPVDDVIASLQASARSIKETKDLLEECIDGLVIDDIQILVSEIVDGSRREILFATLLLTYQKELTQEVPSVIENIFGVDVSSDYDTLITVVTMVVLFYTIDFVYRRINDAASSIHAKVQLDGLITDLAHRLSIPEERVRRTLAVKYRANRLRALADSASVFPYKQKSRECSYSNRQKHHFH